MKQCLLLLGLLVCGWLVHAQSKEVKMDGILIVQHDTIPYGLVFTEANGAIEGYSITYDPPYDTKTKIVGKIDRQARTLSFKETEIISIAAYHRGPALCLIDARLGEKQTSAGNTILKGPILSTETDNTACAPGKVLFENKAQILNLFSYHDKYDTVISMKKRVVDTAATANAIQPAAETTTATEKITMGDEKTFDWKSDTLIVDIWDGGYIDGDRVTITFNGKPVLMGYTLAKEKKRLRLPLVGNDVNVLSIHADNEGSDPPNTASMLFTDGTVHYSILAYNKKGDEAIVRVKKHK